MLTVVRNVIDRSDGKVKLLSMSAQRWWHIDLWANMSALRDALSAFEKFKDVAPYPLYALDGKTLIRWKDPAIESLDKIATLSDQIDKLIKNEPEA